MDDLVLMIIGGIWLMVVFGIYMIVLIVGIVFGISLLVIEGVKKRASMLTLRK